MSDDWEREVERRVAAQWQRAEALDVFVPVDEVIHVGGTGIRIVKTYADGTLTAIGAAPSARLRSLSMRPPGRCVGG